MQTQHQYDEFGRLNGQSWAMGGKAYQETYTYNNQNGSLTGKQITLPTSETANISLGYDGLSRLASVTTPVSKTYYNYADAFYGGGTTRQVSQMSVNPVSTGSNVFTRLYFRYNYDALGNITKIEDFGVGSTIANSTQYTYDEQSQLEKAVSTRYGTWTYDYDTYGNIRRKTHGANTTNYTYNDADWLDLLTAVSGTKDGTSFSESYTYDGAGNPTSYFNVGDLSSWTMTWKNGRELATAGNGTHSVSYDYDVSGLRTYKIVDGVRHDYTYASGLLLRESYTQNGTTYTLDFVYDQSNRPYILNLTATSGSTTTTTAYYYLLNLQGDVLRLVDASGVTVASYDYDPYGNILSATGTLATINPLRYRGYYYDEETEFYYLQSRYYDPQIGRFINADSFASTGQGFLGYNMFAYCNNSPCNKKDSSGRRPMSLLDSLTGDSFGIQGPEDYRGGLIDDQSDFACASWAIGESTVAEQGCLPVAAYNILYSHGHTDISFKQIYDMFLSYDDALVDNGKSGLRSSLLNEVLMQFDQTLCETDDFSDFQSGYLIMWFENDTKHAVAVVNYNDYGIGLYNFGLNGKRILDLHQFMVECNSRDEGWIDFFDYRLYK